MSVARVNRASSSIVASDNPVDGQLRALPSGDAPAKVRALGGAKSKGQYAAGRAVEAADRWTELNMILGAKRPTGRDAATLSQIKAIRDLDPQASLAVWNFLRLLNPGHKLKAVTFDGKGNEVEESGKAQAFLDELATRVGQEYGGGLDQFHNVLALMIVTNGAICAEVAPTEALDGVEDWYAVDPTLITFKRIAVVDGKSVDPNSIVQGPESSKKPSPVKQPPKAKQRDLWSDVFAPNTGSAATAADDAVVWYKLTLGQLFRDGQWHELPSDTVVYQPLDPDVDDPYGRPPLLAAVSQVIGIARVLNDLRAVVHNQGYPRLNVTIVAEAVRKAAPAHLQDPTREKDLAKWVNDQVSQLISDYESLQVDDTFIHFDWVQVDQVGGAGAMNFQGLEQILSRRLNIALKMLPILQGSVEGTTETHGSIQWQIQILTIKALQRLIKRTIERLANVSLQLAGFAASAKLHYDELREYDRILEANADYVETQTAQAQITAGWIDNDEAAQRIVGHKAKDKENPAYKLAAANAETAANPPEPEPAPAPAGGDLLSMLTGGGEPPVDLGTVPIPGLEDGKTAGEKVPTGAPKGGKPKTEAEKKADAAAKAKAKKNMVAMMLLQQTLREPGFPAAVPAAQRYAAQYGASSPARVEARMIAVKAVNEVADRYGKAVKSLFLRSRLSVMAAMRSNGFDLGERAMGEARDIATDIADEAFGLAFRREVKGLLRAAMREGATAAGFDGDIRESALERIWRTNTQYVDRIRDDLRNEIRAGNVDSVESLAQWFGDNAYREDLMGRFVARQGYFSGYAYGVDQVVDGPVGFEWNKGESKESCPSCEERQGETFTYEELQSIGFPGSINLDCAANCQCTLSETRLPPVYAANDFGDELAGLAALGFVGGVVGGEYLTSGDGMPPSEAVEDMPPEAVDLDDESILAEEEDLEEGEDLEEQDDELDAEEDVEWEADLEAEEAPEANPVPSAVTTLGKAPILTKKKAASPDLFLDELEALRARLRGVAS